jgi:two-component system nitrogen regulation response regulator GlnG
VRQLQNVITRLILTARKDMVSLDEAEYALRDQPEMSQVFMSQKGDKLGQDVDRHVRRYFRMHGDSLPPSGLYDRILREIEIPLIEISLEATGGNQAKCADLLGINRNTLRKKINELDIKVTRGRKLM